jgi:PAS domain-containing protein
MSNVQVSPEVLEKVINLSQTGFCTIGLDGRITFVNKGFSNLSSLPIKTLLKKEHIHTIADCPCRQTDVPSQEKKAGFTITVCGN